MKRFSVFNLRMTSWRHLVTLACLFSFVVIGFAHAGEHIEKISTDQTFLMSSLTSDAPDDGLGSPERCHFCCPVTAGNLLGIQPAPKTVADIVTRSFAPLRSSVPLAENPPPIG